MKKIIKSAALGSAVNLGGSYFISSIASVSYAAFLARNNVGLKDIYLSFYSKEYTAFALIVGALFDMAGGYAAAKFNNERHILAGLLSALPCLFIGLFSLLNPLPNEVPIWFIVTSWIIVIPGGMLGGYAAKRWT